MTFSTTGLTNGGRTAHYQIQYDDSIAGGVEPGRCNQLVAACEGDFNLMSGWFGNAVLDVNIPMAVNVTPNSGGAGWSLSGGNLTITVNAGTNDAAFVRYLLVAEVVEQFMRAQNRGWFGAGTEGSEGEGLSRFLAAQFLAINGLGNPRPGFSNSNSWLASDRKDFVNNTRGTDDGPDAVTGCSLLFIYYLFSQLGFSIDQIVAAGANTLGGVYKNLTNTACDPFPFFKALIDASFPGTSTITTGNLDNPFPIGMWRVIGGPAAAIFAGKAGLFATNPDTGDIWRYEGTPETWTRVGGPGATFAVGSQLYGLSPDRCGVWAFTGTPLQWTQVGESAQAIAAASPSLVILDVVGVRMRGA